MEQISKRCELCFDNLLNQPLDTVSFDHLSFKGREKDGQPKSHCCIPELKNQKQKALQVSEEKGGGKTLTSVHALYPN